MPNQPSSAVLLTQCFPPEAHAGANRLASVARALAGRTDLTVVTIEPSYPDPSRFSRVDWQQYDESVPFRIRRTGPFHPHRGSNLTRAVRERRMAVHLAQEAKHLEASIIWATSPSVFVGLAGAALARRTGASFVWEVRDLTWEYLQDAKGRDPRSLLDRSAGTVLGGLVKRALSEADRLVVSNPAIAERLSSLADSAGDRIVLAPNGVSDEIIEMGLRLALEPPECPRRLTYAGAIGHYQGLEVLLDVAQALPEVEIYLVGDGPARSSLQDDAVRRGLANVVFTGYVDRDRLFEIYERSHVLYAGLRDLPSMRATFPSKPFEYMAVGRPIVYSGRGVAADYLERSGAALVVEPDSPDSVEAAVRRLRADQDLWSRLADQGRRQVTMHRRDEIMRGAVDEVLGAFEAGRLGAAS